METYEKEAQKLLRYLGANGSYRGFWLTAYGVAKAVETPELVAYVSKGLYVETAVHFQATIGSAERNIRTVKEVVWKYGDREFLREIFGRDMEKVPSNATFIDGLAHYIAEKCAKPEVVTEGRH